ncbi:uncharacterized protein RSE6_08881 [Rhynchosporium secalis]|uniref:Uncharacterized protein n=1 Tax=Rhynchosporium secalis TaxID=38038 RepID=A0A1E1MGL1_RHYSE|nr:uncharacterized protein RSE6_08881 [Rhynchosporium secalis]
MFKGSESLLKLPLEEKMRRDRSHSIGASHRGYKLIGNQVLQEETLADLNQQRNPSHDARSPKKRFPMSPNIWPNPFHVSEDVFRKSMTEYYSKIYALTLQVLDILSAGTPYGRDIFKEFRSDDPVAALRLLHYPPDRSNRPEAVRR